MSDQKPTRKPAWVIDKERGRRAAAAETIWLFGLHAVRDALVNPRREALRLVLTRNAADRLGEVPMAAEIVDARSFEKVAPLAPDSVHQGAALEVRPLKWGSLSEVCLRPSPQGVRPMVVALDRVTDPHNVGAVLRSAEVFGARAVIAPARHAAPETGALAKAASGALERQPYLRVPNLSDALRDMQNMGFTVIGLDGEAPDTLDRVLAQGPSGAAVCLVLGAEGPGLREGTRAICDRIARIGYPGGFGSLNVSNAAAVALYEAAPVERGGVHIRETEGRDA